eukprot:Em0008g1199a
MEERQKQLVEEKKMPKAETAGSAVGNILPTSLTAATHDAHPPLRIQDSDRTEYVPPIKILRRQPDQQSSTEQACTPTNNTSKSTTKSLAEREAEYASARARILGSVYPSPEDSSTSARRVVVMKGSEPMTETMLKRQPKGPDGTCGFQQLS